MKKSSETPVTKSNKRDLPTRIHRGVLFVLQLIMAVELILVFNRQQWFNAFLIITIMAISLLPSVLGRRFRVYIPPEFQVLAVVFVFAALFLGEIHDYYGRIWWWDIALHTSSGLLMGILGFLLVYVLNESERIDIYMRPRFVAFFAFIFAVAVGALWEIFEFAMDQIVGTTMQKPMLNDPSGLTDTMWDMIVNTLGALAISALGWWYMEQHERSFIEVWIHKFIERNPRLFRS
jgi:uncharacterized membrane protein YjdF